MNIYECWAKEILIYIFFKTICLPNAQNFGKYFVRKLSNLSKIFIIVLFSGIQKVVEHTPPEFRKIRHSVIF